MTAYRARIERVRAAVRGDLAADWSLDALAGVACLSRFHFARVFRAMTGETPVDAVRRARLNRAAVLAVVTDLPVPRIAAACGFGHPGSLERAFRAAFGCTPMQAPARGMVPPALLPSERGEISMFDVEIREESTTVLAAIAHSGAYPEIGRSFDALYGRLGPAAAQAGPAHALYYDDPTAVPVEELRAHAGAAMEAVPDGLDRVEIPAGRVAVLTYTGPYGGLPTPWAYLYGDWLEGSGETPADRPPYERYLNMPGQVPDAELVTEIVMPLASGANAVSQ